MTSRRSATPAETGLLIGAVLGLLAGLGVSSVTGWWWTLPFGLPLGALYGLGIAAGVEQARRPRQEPGAS